MCIYSLDQIEQILLFVADTVRWFCGYFAQQLWQTGFTQIIRQIEFIFQIDVQ